MAMLTILIVHCHIDRRTESFLKIDPLMLCEMSNLKPGPEQSRVHTALSLVL